jgi:hypothetical protein
MRAYRARLRERSERLVDPSLAPAAVVENRRLRNRVAELEDERDRLWAQVVRLQEELRSIGRREHSRGANESATAGNTPSSSRAQRRRLERERARRERRNG